MMRGCRVAMHSRATAGSSGYAECLSDDEEFVACGAELVRFLDLWIPLRGGLSSGKRSVSVRGTSNLMSSPSALTVLHFVPDGLSVS